MRLVILAAALLGLAAPVGVSAGLEYPAALTLEPGFASGPPQGFPWWAIPDLGDPLAIVGRVASVAAPFGGLVPPDAELTYDFEGASCTERGNWDDPGGCAGGVYGTFQNGTLAVYLDATPDADFANPATFRDGELVLVAQTSYVYVLDSDNGSCPWLPNPPDVTAYFMFIGGTWFPRVSHDGAGFRGKSEGELDNNVPADLQSLGYIFRVDGRLDVYGPVAVEPTTWGRVKALYR